MRYQLSDLAFTSDAPLPELEVRHDARSSEVVVRWLREAPAIEAPPYFEWRTPSGGHWLAFGREPDGAFVLTFTHFAQFRISPDASRVEVRPRPGTPDATTRHLLLNQVLPLVLSQRGRLVLHAGAVSAGGRVVAFIGRSGAGKSTLVAAAAAQGGAVVADDCLVLYRRQDAWWAVPCGAGMRLWPQTLALLGWPATSGAGMAHFSEKRRVGRRHAEHHPGLTFEHEARPLSAIFAVFRPDDPAAPSDDALITGRAAVLALASEVFRLDPADVVASRAHFDAVTALAADIPVRVLRRRPPAEAAAGVLCRMTSHDA